jgi:hypothetical protein
MIINIRGGGGSGKSTLIKTILDRAVSRIPIMEHGCKQPLCYRVALAPGGHTVAVLGHYEIACGGCDTISPVSRIWTLVEAAASLGHHVLFEGRMLSADVSHTAELNRTFPGLVRVVGLQVSLEQCLASTNARRLAKDPGATLVDPKKTTGNYKGMLSSMVRLRGEGVATEWLSREAALAYVIHLLQ